MSLIIKLEIKKKLYNKSEHNLILKLYNLTLK